MAATSLTELELGIHLVEVVVVNESKHYMWFVSPFVNDLLRFDSLITKASESITISFLSLFCEDIIWIILTTPVVVWSCEAMKGGNVFRVMNKEFVLSNIFEYVCIKHQIHHFPSKWNDNTCHIIFEYAISNFHYSHSTCLRAFPCNPWYFAVLQSIRFSSCT